MHGNNKLREAAEQRREVRMDEQGSICSLMPQFFDFGVGALHWLVVWPVLVLVGG